MDTKQDTKRKEAEAKLLLAIWTPENYAASKDRLPPKELTAVNRGIAWAKEVLKQSSQLQR